MAAVTNPYLPDLNDPTTYGSSPDRMSPNPNITRNERGSFDYTDRYGTLRRGAFEDMQNVLRKDTQSSLGGVAGYAQQQMAEADRQQQAATQTGNVYGGVGMSALNRQAMPINTGPANYYQAQGQSALGLQSVAARTLLENARAAEGPSAAEAMLRRQSDQTMAGNLALARSGRGAGANPAALRAAAFQNAGQQNQLGTAIAQQRAAEQQAHRQLQLQGNVAASQAAGAFGGSLLANQQQAFGQEIEKARIDQQQQQINNQLFQGAGQLGLGHGQLATTWNQQGIDAATAQSNIHRDIVAIDAEQYSGAQNRAQQERAGLVGAGATIGAGIITAASDRRAKEDVRPLTTRDLLRAERDADPRVIRAVYPELRPPEVQYPDDPPPAASGGFYSPDVRQPDLAALDAAYASDRRAKRRMYASDIDAKRDVRLEDLDAIAGQADTIRGTRAVYPTVGRGGDAQLAAELDAAGGATERGIRGGRAVYPALETVRNAPGYSYEYKDPERHGEGRFYGPMAQSLEKTPAGRSTVKEAPDGTKMVDTGRLSLVNTAALHEQQMQLDAMDEELRKMERVFGRRTAYPELR